VTLHGRFGTATVRWPEGLVDIAARRAESYAAPGALPDVRPGSIEEDLARRDFSVNAIALVLAGPQAGTLCWAPHALEDLDAQRLRVLHEESFADDPTRLLRLARYGARLGFENEPGTAALAEQAVANGALASLSGARSGAELRFALGEADALAALRRMDDLGVLAALGLRSPLPERRAADALALLPADGRPAELLMAILSDGGASLERFELMAGERERIAAAARDAAKLTADIERATRPSELRDVLGAATPEAVALAGASAGPAGREAARRWLDDLRHVRLRISGDDLLAAGVPAGPELGRRLAGALAMKLDGELEDGAEAELAAALKARA
jgi:tRNA nucleotidyltransferase (CCA-adding enzyme)